MNQPVDCCCKRCSKSEERKHQSSGSVEQIPQVLSLWLAVEYQMTGKDQIRDADKFLRQFGTSFSVCTQKSKYGISTSNRKFKKIRKVAEVLSNFSSKSCV
ncbi:uncharacterized protein LOC141915198 [Tubulanus polymorphus]|uniref:uncharacterized protein LOC141915198 n=1 Tax=Tubulanus polymorphus TaxID=672921 RepID=UPI003DA5A49C